MFVKNQEIAGRYGDYELVFATEDAIEEYFGACLEILNPAEMYESWQLYHLCAKDVLEKFFVQIQEDRAKAYFLLYHVSEEEKKVVGIGGFGAFAELGENVGEIWFMGQSFMEHKRFLVRHGRNIIGKILSHYPTLLNIAAVWNNEAVRLVKYLGFTVGAKPIRAGVDKALFNYFYITRK